MPLALTWDFRPLRLFAEVAVAAHVAPLAWLPVPGARVGVGAPWLF